MVINSYTIIYDDYTTTWCKMMVEDQMTEVMLITMHFLLKLIYLFTHFVTTTRMVT